ncbi:SURF1 family cytochrome oxidase biogenesis protein [Naasia sp. SYSU D00948]|uniref:SURF1 family cytochrome oxidase biogenesis protein n=1 Tax=Naasia sp. SYSU D00948 TaxID=2817379 RepID=UPI001B314482|nr:SURF1 family cytochrome oxidase biogenesis protein [Naasia sp. SYSU D00948]
MRKARSLFPPPLLAVMRRPTSIGLLLLAVAVAVVFALFGQWQLSRAVQNGDVLERPTETVLPLSEVAEPHTPTSNRAVGQLVAVSGEWVEGDFFALRDRLDNGDAGYWTVGHLRTDEGASLAVALGWTPERQEAIDAAERWNDDSSVLPAEVSGRFQHSEAPTPPEGDDPLPREMSPASFVNQWQDPEPAYAGYVTLREAPEPLQSIWSPAPETEVALNFLNLFYALEWVLFSVAALYIWYRLMRDIYEREQDEAAAAQAAGDDAPREGAQRATVD